MNWPPWLKKLFFRRPLVIGIVAVIGIGIGIELFTRFYLGLGSPPLFIRHTEIEYLLKPNQDLYRFGNHYLVNEYSMRSTAVPERKSPGDYRILAFGDSVLNGGSRTDHEQLATSRLEKSLQGRFPGKVWVGNVSASSWGPGNWLGYARTYGFFDADLVIVVLSSHDLSDCPTFEPLNPVTHATEKPLCATTEMTKFFPRYLERDQGFPTGGNHDHIPTAGDDLIAFLKLAKEKVGDVLVFQHWELDELGQNKPSSEIAAIQTICSVSACVPWISLHSYYESYEGALEDLYRDNIHISATGQAVLEKAILDHLP